MSSPPRNSNRGAPGRPVLRVCLLLALFPCTRGGAASEDPERDELRFDLDAAEESDVLRFDLDYGTREEVPRPRAAVAPRRRAADDELRFDLDYAEEESDELDFDLDYGTDGRVLDPAPGPDREGDEPDVGPDPPEGPGGRDPGETPPPEDPAPDEPTLFERLRDDPSLGGKLSLAYRATYQARIYDFKRNEFNFQPVTSDDLEQARQMRERRRDDRSDQDITQYLSLQTRDLFTPWEDSGVFQSFNTDVALYYAKDIDGSPAGEEDRGGYDRFEHRQEYQLRRALVNFETFSRHLEVTLGRQYTQEAEWAHFDGATLKLRGLRLFDQETEWVAFGGSRVKFYRRSSSSHDGIAGGSFTARLGQDTTLELSDVYYLNNVFEAELSQEVFDLGDVTLGYRQIDSEPHSVRLEGTFHWLDHDVFLYLRYLAKVSDGEDDFVFDFTQSSLRRSSDQAETHFNIGAIEPYHDIMAELRKGFLEHYGASVGGIAHVLNDSGDEDNYNTNWYELWAGLDVLHAPWEGLTGRVTFRYVHTDLPRRRLRLDQSDLANGLPDFRAEDVTGDGEPSFFGVELLLEQDFHRVVAVGATTEFRNYEYQSNFADVDDMTNTSAGAYVRWRPLARHELELKYSYDRDFTVWYPDIDGLHTIRAQYQYRF